MSHLIGNKRRRKNLKQKILFKNKFVMSFNLNQKLKDRIELEI